ncbi:site-specific integrase [Mycobacterium intracellulare]|uniref:site-specific integrase n=1 Tax=Mycobacterium intracellulare TaxID=1767 RepID=UPI000A3EEA93|nr:site-specific integrase [Mycobacterium intracellulare]
MSVDGEQERDIAVLSVPVLGSLVQTNDSWEPFRLVDPTGAVVDGVSAFFRDLQAAGRSEATIRSYGMDLLRWFRFLWAIEVPWQRATRVEARDFSRWMLVAGKPARPHWRRPTVVPKTKQRKESYSASVRAHSETVLRSFYDFHLDAGTGPLVNPFPLDRARRGRRATRITIRWNHTVMSARACIGRRRRRGFLAASPTRSSTRSLRGCRRSAIGRWWRSTSPRGKASELLSLLRWCRPGQGVIALTRKGSRAIQELPASSDAFVWLRLYQVEMKGVFRRVASAVVVDVPNSVAAVDLSCGASDVRTGRQGAGSTATLHACAYRGVSDGRDPDLPLTDVQFVLGHALLTTTQITDPAQAGRNPQNPRPSCPADEKGRRASASTPAPGYRPETLRVLFGGESR